MHLLHIFYSFKYYKVYLKNSLEKILIRNLTKNEVTVSFVLTFLSCQPTCCHKFTLLYSYPALCNKLLGNYMHFTLKLTFLFKKIYIFFKYIKNIYF